MSRSVGAPAVLVVDDRGGVLHRTALTTRLIDDLSDAASPAPALPPAVESAIARLRAVEGAPSAASGATAHPLRARGRSGRWYTLHAARGEPDADGRSVVVVVIAPVRRAEVAPLLARRHGLSPREREVLAHAARGAPTKQIAAALGISAYTVQDHIDRACDKLGVRGRAALLAQLFLEGAGP